MYIALMLAESDAYGVIEVCPFAVHTNLNSWFDYLAVKVHWHRWILYFWSAVRLVSMIGSRIFELCWFDHLFFFHRQRVYQHVWFEFPHITVDEQLSAQLNLDEKVELKSSVLAACLVLQMSIFGFHGCLVRKKLLAGLVLFSRRENGQCHNQDYNMF